MKTNPLFSVLLVSLALGLGARAQQSANYQLKAHDLNAGGSPVNGAALTSPNYKCVVSSIGDGLASAGVASGSYKAETGYPATTLSNCPTIALSPSSLPAGKLGKPYSQTITASGGTAPYAFAVTSGSLPAGLSLTPAGLLSGMPTVPGTSSFTVTATDAHACMGGQAYTITASVLPPVVALMKKAVSSPFTLVVTGSNLQNSMAVFINGTPWVSLTWKSTAKTKITGGKSLKTAVPKGQTTHFKFVNPDGGEATYDFTY